MAEFSPKPNDRITIGGRTYVFLPDLLMPDWIEHAYAVEGGEAVVYKLRDLDGHSEFALRVSFPAFRGPHIQQVTDALAPFQTVPGLHAARRLCLTPATAPALLAEYPELAFATLSRWIPWRSWSYLMFDGRVANAYTADNALTVAAATAETLALLEARGAAHCDVSSANVLVSPEKDDIQLLDIDGIYIQAGSLRPARLPQGTSGYRHPALGPTDTQWGPYADRFAGAILLTEMIAWADNAVRASVSAGAESLFLQSELGMTGAPVWTAVRDALYTYCPPALQLFDRAWFSSSLDACAPLAAWRNILCEPFGK